MSSLFELHNESDLGSESGSGYIGHDNHDDKIGIGSIIILPVSIICLGILWALVTKPKKIPKPVGPVREYEPEEESIPTLYLEHPEEWLEETEV